MVSAGHVRHSAQAARIACLLYAFNTSQAGRTLPHQWHHHRVRHRYSLSYPWIQPDQPHSGSAQGGARTRSLACGRLPRSLGSIAPLALRMSQAGRLHKQQWHHRRVRHRYSLSYPWIQPDQPHSGSAQSGARTRSLACQRLSRTLGSIASRAFNTSQAGRLHPQQWHHRRVRHRYSLSYPWIQPDQPHSG